MKKDYILKPFKGNADLDELDKQKRNKIEEKLGKKFSDYEWEQYRKMTQVKNKSSL